MSEFVASCCFYYQYNENLPIVVRSQDRKVKTLLIFNFVLILIVLILSYIKWISQFPLTYITAKWYPSYRNITNDQHRIYPDVIVKNQTMILIFFLKPKYFFLIFMYLLPYLFVNDNTFFSFWEYLVFFCSLIQILHPCVYYHKNKT